MGMFQFVPFLMHFPLEMAWPLGQHLAIVTLSFNVWDGHVTATVEPVGKVSKQKYISGLCLLGVPATLDMTDLSPWLLKLDVTYKFNIM